MTHIITIICYYILDKHASDTTDTSDTTDASDSDASNTSDTTDADGASGSPILNYVLLSIAN